MKIPIQSPPDYHSLVPPDISGQPPEPQPMSDGMNVDNMSPEQANSIPDEGDATVGYKVHRRQSETHIAKDGSKKEKHSVHMHVTHFHPHGDADKKDGDDKEPQKKSKKIQKDAQEAVREHFEG